METNKSVLNQKAFVLLSGVLELQKEYHRAVLAHDAAKTANSAPSELKSIQRARIEAFERTIRILGLPIDLHRI